MVTYYNKGDMISFGKYLVSKERREYYERNPKVDLSLEDRLAMVSRTDVDNWLATA